MTVREGDAVPTDEPVRPALDDEPDPRALRAWGWRSADELPALATVTDLSWTAARQTSWATCPWRGGP